MEKKQPFAQRMETFFAGKGFYIVLALCLTIIGLSAWSMLSGPGTSAVPEDAAVAVGKLEEASVAAVTAGTPAPVPTASPAPRAEPIPETPVVTAAPTLNVPEAAANGAQSYFVWPVTGEVEQPYSVTALLYDPTMRDWRTHDGLDIAAELGSSVRAVTDGQVTELREDPLLGTTVVLAHRDGLSSCYSNLAALPTVSVGQQVSVGQIIGAVGDTALGEAGVVCHLHFAMAQDGVSIDPGAYLP